MKGISRAAVRDLTPIGLAELQHHASLQDRTDRKYVIPRQDLETFLAAVRDTTRVLTIGHGRIFRYESTYFDTPELGTYRAAATGRPQRFKVRTRSYIDSGRCQLEVKLKQRTGNMVKRSMPYEPEHSDELTQEALDFLAGFDVVAPVLSSLERTLTTRYARTTLFEAATGSRVTIDTGLEYEAPDRTRITVPGLVLVETKTHGAACDADRVLWRMHHRPTRVSKYCVGLALLHPELPSNRWNRVIHREFGSVLFDRSKVMTANRTTRTYGWSDTAYAGPLATHVGAAAG